MNPVLTLRSTIKSSLNIRKISTSQQLLRNDRKQAIYERKNRPFTMIDKARDELTAKAVHHRKKDGHKLLQEALAKHVAQPPGKIDQRSKKFRVIPEMIPEFIVPDLTNFKLKPYVSYSSEEIVQEQITARQLFTSCYADKIREVKEKAKSQEAKTKSQGTQVDDPNVKS